MSSKDYTNCIICDEEICIEKPWYETRDGVPHVSICLTEIVGMVPRSCPHCKRDMCHYCVMMCHTCANEDYVFNNVSCFECSDKSKLNLVCKKHDWYTCPNHEVKECGRCYANLNYHRKHDW